MLVSFFKDGPFGVRHTAAIGTDYTDGFRGVNGFLSRGVIHNVRVKLVLTGQRATRWAPHLQNATLPILLTTRQPGCKEGNRTRVAGMLFSVRKPFLREPFRQLILLVFVKRV